MTGPLFSVLTTCYNDGAWLPQAIASLRAQSFEGWEHVLVNNGSMDLTADIADLWQMESPGRVVVRHIAHRSQPAAINYAATQASGRWLVWLNADDLLVPDALDTLAQMIHNYPSVNCITSPLEYFGAVQMVYTPRPYNPASIAEEHQINGVRAVRRDVWDRTGGEDERLPVEVGADWDWAVRASLVGLEPLFFPRPLWRCRKFRDGNRLTDRGNVPALKAHMRRHLVPA